MRKLIMYIGLCIAALSAVSCQDDVDGEQYEQYASFKAVIGSNGVTDIYVRYKESGKVGGRLYYGFFCIPGEKSPFRYIFFKNKALTSPENPEITLVYMEGEATLEELKRMFE